ncbi:hypothetical protein ACIBTV_27635 [Micromonospora sp. NPDC049366]|uniref:hypothetical protein n=1 Tax=Micromonospora sp. NPDC049366 TaxID=3364271 RepID=UPI0037AF2936
MSATARPGAARRAVAALEERLDGDPHLPHQPSWNCRGCNGAVPWPCPPARTRLAEAYRGDRVNLSMYLGSLLTAALMEMTETPPGELFERFIAWTR